ncbi:ribonuclease H-like domain-containing protein [Tanacetum coccineum]
MMTYGIPTSVQVLPAQQPPAQFSSLYAFAPGPQAHQSLMHYYRAPIMHPAPVYYAPAFPHAFHTMALQNTNWNMDTGASSHLADNTDGRLLLCCDSTGDLYPVTQQPSSQSPVVLLSFSSTTWHRRLGHPGDDVLRRLESKNLISCRFVSCMSIRTLVLVPRPANVNVVRSMWLFKHKFNADGSLSRYKARLVANGRSQHQGIDCDETFNPVVKPATIRTVLSLAVSRDWPIHQLDVKNAFLHGHLSETVYMHQPHGFVDPNKPNYHSKTDSSLFVFHRGSDIAYLLLYVDDIILTASSSAFLQRIIASLHSEFAMTDLGSLNYFLGISAQRSASGLFLSQAQNLQRKFLSELICRILHVSSTTQLSAYTDADWAGCPVTRRAEAEYRGVANVVAETAWIRNLLCELHTPLFTTTLVFVNVCAVIYVTNSNSPSTHEHIEIDISFCS